MNLKITKEAEFLRWIFFIAALGMFEILRESESYKFDDANKSHIQMQLTRVLMEGNEQFLLEFFEQRIRDGYVSGDEQRVVLAAFNEMPRIVGI